MSHIFKVVIGVEAGAFITTLLGFAVPLWISASDQIPVNVFFPTGGTVHVKLDHLGLWQACGGDQGCITLVPSGLPGFLTAARLFMTLGLIGSILSAIATVLFLVANNVRNNAKFRLFFWIDALVTAACIFIAVTSFGATVKYFLSFAFAMACIGCILYLVKGIVLLWYFRTTST